jgi:hypothetical protein
VFVPGEAFAICANRDGYSFRRTSSFGNQSPGLMDHGPKEKRLVRTAVGLAMSYMDAGARNFFLALGSRLGRKAVKMPMAGRNAQR